MLGFIKSLSLQWQPYWHGIKESNEGARTMKVEIHNVDGEPGDVYIADCEEDCRTSLDKSVYQMCVELQEAVCMGGVIAYPIVISKDF